MSHEMKWGECFFISISSNLKKSVKSKIFVRNIYCIHIVTTLYINIHCNSTMLEGKKMEIAIIISKPKSKSNATHLYLKKVTKSLKGRYSCEVSADAPSFRTAIYSGDMNVVVTPTSLPEVELTKSKYRVGETLKAKCTSRSSRPAANLTWGLNGQLLDSENVKKFTVIRDPDTNLETSVSTLSLVLQRHHFSSNGRLKVRCTASVHNIYWKSTERSAEEEKPKVLDAAQVRKPTDIFYETTPAPSRSSRAAHRRFSFGIMEPLISSRYFLLVLCSLVNIFWWRYM